MERKSFVVILALLISLTTMVFSELSFQIIIGIGNVPNISLGDLPEYSVLLYVDEPLATVYIDGKYAGITDGFGRIVVKFDSEGHHSVWVVSSNQYTVFDRFVFYVEKNPKIVYVPSTRLGMVTVFSNVYPVSIYSSKGYLLGMIDKDGKSAFVPVGNQELTFSCPGFEDLRQSVTINYGKETPVWLQFKPVPFNLELVASERFSPNGDWDNDECIIKIYSSRPATGSIQILNSSGIIAFEKNLKINAGTTQLNWDGRGNPDGIYTVRVLLSDGISSVEKQVRTTLDSSVYTYKKEIVITLMLLFAGLIGYLVWSGK